jgi:hypothetical protein
MCYKDVPAPDGYQHCPHCRQTKPQADFERSVRRASGFAQRCRVCLTEYREGRWTIRSINEGAFFNAVSASRPPAALADLLLSDIQLDGLG